MVVLVKSKYADAASEILPVRRVTFPSAEAHPPGARRAAAASTSVRVLFTISQSGHRHMSL